MTEREKMVSGEWFLTGDPELMRCKAHSRELCAEYNATGEREPENRVRILNELFGVCGDAPSSGAHEEPESCLRRSVRRPSSS